MRNLSWKGETGGNEDYYLDLHAKAEMNHTTTHILNLLSTVPSSHIFLHNFTSDFNSTSTNSCDDCWDSGFLDEGFNVNQSVLTNESDTKVGSLDLANQGSNGQDELYDVPVSIIVLLSFLYGGISAMALIGNLLVLWIVAVSRRMRTVTNMFIANLALADIIIGLFTIPFQFQAALLQRWNLPDFMCAFCPFVQVLSVTVSVFTLSAIAVDRYKAVCFPLSARVSKRKATYVILSIWTLSVLIALPTELDYKVIYVKDKKELKPFCANKGLSRNFRKSYTIGLVFIQYFVPLVIQTFAYVIMGIRLWGTTAPGNKEDLRDAVIIRNKKKVIKMLAVVVLLFSLCWAPLQMYNFLQTLIPKINQYQYINIIWFSFHWLAMSNSCCNPFIYAIYNDKFQCEFRARFFWLRKLCKCIRFGSEYPDNYSDASDIDRSKVRASYRFKNNHSVRDNQQRVYNNNMRLNRVRSARNSHDANCNGFATSLKPSSSSMRVNDKRNHQSSSALPTHNHDRYTSSQRPKDLEVKVKKNGNAITSVISCVGESPILLHIQPPTPTPPLTSGGSMETAVIASNSFKDDNYSSGSLELKTTTVVVATETTTML